MHIYTLFLELDQDIRDCQCTGSFHVSSRYITGYCYYSHYLILLLQLPPAAASGAHPPITTPVDSTATASMKNVSCLSQKGGCLGEEEERRVYFISINM